MKKRILLITFFIINFLLISDIGYAPSSKAPEIQTKSILNSDQSRPPSRTRIWNKDGEQYLEREESRLEFKADSSNVELIGMWPYGACEASALDTTRNIAVIGNGETLQVLDISTPSSPSKIGEVFLEAKPYDIAISGNYAYVVTSYSLRVIDISVLSNPEEVGTAGIAGYGFTLEISSNYAYVAAYSGGLRIFDISTPTNPTEVGFFDPGYPDYFYAYDVSIWENHAFIIGQYWTGTGYIYQLRIIDISIPSTPSLTGTYQGEVDYYFMGVDASDTGYAYISQYSDYAGENTTELTIIDVATDPANPSEVGNYAESDRAFIDVVVSGNYAYLFELREWILEIIDISNPSNPFYVGECDGAGRWFVEWGLDISGNYVGIPNYGTGFSLYDVSDLSNPFHAGSYDTPGAIGYYGNCIAVSGDFAYLANRGNDGLRIMDISTPSNPSTVGICDTVEGYAGVVVSGDYAYGVDSSGFWIVDISTPSSPYQVGYLDIPWRTWDVAVSGNYAYVSGYQYISDEPRASLAIIDVSDPASPSLVGSYVCSYRSFNYGGIALSGNYAYLGLRDYSTGSLKAGLKIIDISNPANPTERSTYVSDEYGYTYNVVTRGNYAYLAGDGFRIIDISNPWSPSEISKYNYLCEGLAISGNYAYLAEEGLTLIDISNPYNPTEAGYYNIDLGDALVVSGNYAYIHGSLYILKNILAPEVSITSPSAWSDVSGSVSIEAQASHSSGIAGVEFYIDDVLRLTDSTSPYSHVWDTSSVTEGSHKIRARAYNNDGKSSDFEIEVTVRNLWNLTISSTSGGTTDPEPETYSYALGIDVSVEAFPNSGYDFSGWSGDASGSANPITITMDSDKSVTANFTMVEGNYGLTINSALAGTTNPTPGAYSYPAGTVVPITALPDPECSFLDWTGNVPSGHENDNPLYITMDSAKSITPHFSFAQTWTFMVYLEGDNNLEGAAIDDFLEMASVGSDANINIVVQFDRIDGYDDSYGDWTSTKRFYVTKGMIPTSENALEDLGELNSGDTQTLIDFINWTKENFPANNYAFILWLPGGDEGKSKEELWQEKLEGKKELIFRAVGWDDTDGGDTLHRGEVRSVFGSSGGVELIGFDASMMAMVEYAYLLRSDGEVMVGSEGIEPRDGWPYDAILQDLTGNPTWSSSELGTAIVDRYYESYGNDETLSAIDLGNMDTLASTVSSFAQTMIDNWDSDQDAVRDAAQDLMTEIENTVIHEQHGSAWPGANGLAIYFPEDSSDFESDYGTEMDFPDDTQWDEFLTEFYSSMEGSWIEERRYVSQQFDESQFIDLYDFCEKLSTLRLNYYSQSLIPHEYIEGGIAQDFQYDDAVLSYPLPFDFPYFGEIIPAGTDIYICTNGFVDFEVSSYDSTNTGYEAVNNMRIAACWTDLRTDGSAQDGEDIYITENSDNLVIRWLAETYYYEEPANVELILYDDGRIQFNYDGGNADLEVWDSPTIGICKGDGVNYYASVYNDENTLTNVDSELFTPVWSPPSTPTNPFPAYEAPGVSVNTGLAWDSSSATSYDVYFGSSSSPPKAGTVTDSFYDPGVLNINITYYWKIVARNDIGESEGPEWSFTTSDCPTPPSMPSNPSPSAGTTGVLVDADLDWDESSGATSYDVYFGTTSPPPEVEAVSSSTYDPGTLDSNTTYYWKIVAKNECGETEGFEWNFTTCIVPGTPGGPSPPDGATWVSLNADLDWDESSGATSYDVYFGTTSPPPEVGTVTSSTYDPGTLDSNTTYYWKVVAKNACGETQGSVWQFTTITLPIPQRTWTFMVYLDGDNNLEEAGIDDFLEMASVGSDANINIVVQFDRIDGYDDSYGDWASTKRFYVTNGMIPTSENALEDPGELNHGDPQTLIDFVNWAKENFPADNYALILWNHGGGWRIYKEQLIQQQKLEGRKELIFKAVCWDDTNGGDSLQMGEVQSALGSSGGAELIGFDACLMGMVEVAYEIRSHGEVMVGSEETEPWEGWPYRTILQDLTGNPTWSSSELGTAIVDRYYESYGNDETQSAIDLGNLDTLASTVSSFAQTMTDSWDSDQDAVRDAAQDLMTEIDNTVIHEQHGSAWPGANGLAIYFPETSGDFSLDYHGTIIDFPDNTQWDEFLQEFYSSMGGSWIAEKRTVSQHFDYQEHIDLYDFCEKLSTVPPNYYSQSLVLHEYIGGGIAQNFQYDDAVLSYPLPFDFPYFGEIIPAGTDIYICSNGFVDFAFSYHGYDYYYPNDGFELLHHKRIAPCWTDLKTDGSAQEGEDIYITENSDNLVIRWVAETFGYEEPANVELILYDDGRIQFNYDGGNVALVVYDLPRIGISKGDGFNYHLSVYDGENTLTNVDSELFTPAWSPPAQPTNPFPADEAPGVSVNTGLAWDSSGATSYDVYFGTSSPPPEVGTVTSSTYDPGVLTIDTIYYWKIVARNDFGQPEGPEWIFTTSDCPTPPTMPSNPSPSDGTNGVLVDADLDWDDSSGATSYDVYFGTTSPPLEFETVTSSTYDPGTLDSNTTYYWTVVAENECGGTEGLEWSFTTCILPGTPGGPSPLNGATWVSVNADLNWDDSSGATSYDVYFGTTSSPIKVGTVTSSTYDPGTLDYNTTYYWKVVAKNACGETEGLEWSFTTITLPIPQRTWTFMVYLDGDNNLEEAAIGDFLDIASVGSDANINIVVQFDRIDGYDDSYGNWTSTKRFYVTNGMIPTSENALEDLGELNHGDPQTLIDFVNWAKENFPANNYALILWNHGGGWRIHKEELPQEKLEGRKELIFREVCWDYTDGMDKLYMQELKNALGSSGGAELIGFDARLMSMVEVAYEIRNYGEVMVGSETGYFFRFWPFDTILQDLTGNPTWSSSELGTAIVDSSSYENYQNAWSAIDLSNMGTLASTVSSFAQTMIDNWHSDQDTVQDAAQAVMTEIDNTVIHEQHGSLWPGVNGLAIYFPETLVEFNSDYHGTIIDFPNDTQWDEFLQEFYSSMEGSWIAEKRDVSQQAMPRQGFSDSAHIDLYNFCELITTETEDLYARSQIPHEYIGGGKARGFHYDDGVLSYALPFDFPYFGEVIPAGTEIYICTNGFVDFAVSSHGYDAYNYNDGFELLSHKRIAPCWTDLKTDGYAQDGEDLYITKNSDNLVIRWVAETYGYAEPANVELILYDDGRIQFNYDGGNVDLEVYDLPRIGISKGDGFNYYLSVYSGENTLTNVDSELFTPTWSPPSIPTNPSPADETTDVSVDTNLAWDSSGAISYDVHFGTSSPPPKVGTVTDGFYDLEALNHGENYYWKIVAINAYGETPGPEWQFTTYALLTYTISGKVTTVEPSGKMKIEEGPNEVVKIDLSRNRRADKMGISSSSYRIRTQAGLSGVEMNGLPGNPTTDASGNYSVTVDYGWSGTATPSLAGYIFEPSSIEYSDVTSDQTGQNYTATYMIYTISGIVTVDGSGLEGVLMNGLPGDPTTNDSGNYSATVEHGWSGTATPTKAGYTFSPYSRSYGNVASDKPGHDYTATAITTANPWTNAGLSRKYINDLAIDPTSSNKVFAAIYGSSNHMAITTDGGTSWQDLVNSPTNIYSVEIDPENPSTLYAGRVSLYNSTDGGENWSQMHNFLSDAITDILLKSGYIFLTTYDEIWGSWSVGVFRGWGSIWQNVVDYRCLTLAETPSRIYVGTASSGNVFMSSSYELSLGGIWKQISPSGHWSNRVEDIEIDLSSNVYAANDNGLWKGKENDANWTWTKLTGLPFDTLRSAHFADSNTGWAVGHYGTILKTNDGGTSWSLQESEVKYNLYSVHFIDANNGWAVGGYGTTLRTTDGGNNWVWPYRGTENTLYSVYFTDTDNGWAVGYDGTILKGTYDGNWTAQTSGTSDALYSVYFTDSNTGWVVGDVGTILKTTDGGNTWTPQTSGAGGSCLNSVYFTDSNTGWAVGDEGTIIKTTDGGNSWTSQTSPTSNMLLSVYFINSNTGWVMGDMGTILKTTDGGNSWVSQTSGESNWLDSVYFSDSNTGWAVGRLGTILKTTDSGSSWTPQTSGITHNITALAMDRTTNPEVLYASTYGNGVFASTDGGDTWTEFNDGLGNPNITKLAISDANPKILYAGTNDGVWSRNIVSQYTLTITAGTGGTTDPEPATYSYAIGAEVSITATPDTGYEFAEWTGDVPSDHENDNPLIITMDSDKSVTANFSSAIIHVSISGTVKTSGVGGIAGVTITFSNEGGSTTTDSKGNYSQSVNEGWSGTATPSKVGYTFLPDSRSYTDVTSDQAGQDYTATLLTYTISGMVSRGEALGKMKVAGGPRSEINSEFPQNRQTDKMSVSSSSGIMVTKSGLSGVVMNGLPGNPTTDDSGNYSAIVDFGWSGTATPTIAGYTFTPPSKTYPDITSDQTGQNYTATILTYTVSGKVSTGEDSSSRMIRDVGGLSGVVMDGLPGNPPTGASGNYSATVDYGWSGTVTPTKAGYSFSPPSKTYANVTSDQQNQNYSASIFRPTLTIVCGDGGMTTPSPGSYVYDYGAEVSITATPGSGCRCAAWTGDVPAGCENDNPVTITMDSNKTITANFIAQHTLTIAAGTGGTTDPEPGSYPCDHGTQVSVTATVTGTGYQFSGWTGAATGTTNPVTITMDADKTLTANFNPPQPPDEPGGGDGGAKKGGCFIATAAYGSPLHPHLDILRDFRDTYLMPSKLGSKLVDLYYKYSPSAADLIAKYKVLRVVARLNLLPFVALSYSMLHIGPLFIVVIFMFILTFPGFLISLFRWKMRREDSREKLASLRSK